MSRDDGGTGSAPVTMWPGKSSITCWPGSQAGTSKYSGRMGTGTTRTGVVTPARRKAFRVLLLAVRISARRSATRTQLFRGL